MTELSVIIPARNEEFLALTIDDILKNKRADTEVIAILDGYWPQPVIKDDPNVVLIHRTRPIGQRAAVNLGARIAAGKYIMKLDAHCAVSEGFDAELVKNCEPDWTVIPRMYNLHAFDWMCPACGRRQYQGPPPKACKCGGTHFDKQLIWRPRLKRRTDFARFDGTLKFGYWIDYEKRPEAKGDIVDVMSSLGACFMMERQRFFDLDGLDENHGSWGQVGTEIACKSWLSGGRQVVNKKAWFAHMFRTRNGFSFPYEISHDQQMAARAYSRKLWLENRWPGQQRSLAWLIDKFKPIPGWPAPTKGNAEIELSILIPARNEAYLQATIDDITTNFTSRYEIIVGLDDYDPDPPIKPAPTVKIIRSEKRLGMRPLINMLADHAKGRYIMRVDAHCAFDVGYDSKLIDIYRSGDTVLGVRYELDTTAWQRRERTNCDFRYLSHPQADAPDGLRGLAWHELKDRTRGQSMAETMTISGSCWLMERQQFIAWGKLDANHGTFGQEGCEISCKTWLSGGRVRVNRKTWYAHHNRGKAPYALSRRQRDKSVAYSKTLWLENRWPLQKYSFDYLIDRFKPVPGWPVPKDGAIKAPRQGTILKGYINVTPDMLWDQRAFISEPAKRYRLDIFWLAFDELVKELLDGKTFTPAQMCETRYWHYLKTHLPAAWRQPLSEKGKAHLIKKFTGAIKLFESVKKNGLRSPLELYQQDKKLILYKGYRRLVIVRNLAFKSVACVIHKIEQLAKNRPPLFASMMRGGIEAMGAKQFAEYGNLATDKYWTHNYLSIYDNLFRGLRHKKIKILEFGVLHGASLRLWHQAFPKAQIYGVDKNETSWQRMTADLDRLRVFVGRQQDPALLDAVAAAGPYDIIIDDCGHDPENQWLCFTRMYREALRRNGYYVIEDCYRSFKSGHAGTNVPEQLSYWVSSIYHDYKISELLFYYNLCVVRKGMGEI